MAQVLKKESREAIIEAGKKEFLENGYENASMRNIAAKTGMTVGNLYRYFAGKDALFEAVCAETRDELAEVLNSLNSESLQMETRVFALKADIADVLKMTADFVMKIMTIYHKHQDGFLIILNDKKENEMLKQWFGKVIRSLIFQHLLNNEDLENGELLLKAHTASLLCGLQQIFACQDETRIDSVLKIYLDSYIIMLDNMTGKRVN